MLNQKLIEGLSHFLPAPDYGECIEPHFSWFRSGCDACNSTLGGNCYTVQCCLDDNTVTSIEVCQDCYIELCS